MCCVSVQDYLSIVLEILPFFVGSLVALILEIAAWIYFIILLAKNDGINLDSLQIVMHNLNDDDETIFITIGGSLKKHDNCYIFPDKGHAKKALSILQDDYRISRGIGIFWAILQIFFIFEMALDILLKLLKYRKQLTTDQFYFGYLKLILTTYSNTILIILLKVDFDNQCLDGYPSILGSWISPLIPMYLGITLLVLTIIGYIFCWWNHGNPIFSLTYIIELMKFEQFIDERHQSDINNCMQCQVYFHFTFFGFLILFSIFITLSSNVVLCVLTLIIFVLEMIGQIKKYRKLVKNSFRPIVLESGNENQSKIFP